MGKTFILGGLVLTFTLGNFFALIFTNNMKDNVVKLIVSLMIAFVIGYGVLDYKRDERNYNNGVCSVCYEKLELLDTEHNRNSSDLYYYKCKNNHLVKTSNYFY